MSTRSRMMRGLGALLVGGALLAAAPQASASEPQAPMAGSVTAFTDTVQAEGNGEATGSFIFPTCVWTFSGPVISNDGPIVASLDDVATQGCDRDTTVAPRSLPWTLTFREGRGYTIDGIQVAITTPQGTCLYAGSVSGGFQFPPNLYDAIATATRQSDGGCGMEEQLTRHGWADITVADDN